MTFVCPGPAPVRFAPLLSGTDTGKTVRRIVRKIATDVSDRLGDPTTLANRAVVDDLVEYRQNR